MDRGSEIHHEYTSYILIFTLFLSQMRFCPRSLSSVYTERPLRDCVKEFVNILSVVHILLFILVLFFQFFFNFFLSTTGNSGNRQDLTKRFD